MSTQSVRFIVAVLTCGSMLHANAGAATWPTFDGNAARAAWLNSDTSINRRNAKRLHLKWVAKLDAVADSTPVYWPAVHVGSAKVSMLFQTDGAGTTYGINAATGTIAWRFHTTGPKITASTPVLGPQGRDLYVPGIDGYIHKLDAASGSEVTAPGFPAQITLMNETEKDASPLNLANGYVYAATSGYIGDAPPYDGHVVTVRLKDGKTSVFNSLCSNLPMLLTGSECSSQRSGVWARAGVVVDPDPSMNGHAYFSTGNGPYAQKKDDYGDTVLALSADGSALVDWFTPSDRKKLWEEDLDLGSTAPAMLPPVANSATPFMAVQGGKSQVLYLLDRTHLGGVGGQLQGLSLPGEVFSAPAVWVDASGQILVYLGLLPDSSNVLAFKLTTDGQGRSRLQPAWSSNVGGTSPVAIGGVVFVAASGALTALDADTGTTVWTSTAPSSGGTIGGIHWQSPIAVNGGVYVSDRNGNLNAYTIDGK